MRACKALIASAVLLAAPALAQSIDAEPRWTAPPQQAMPPAPEPTDSLNPISGGYVGLRGSMAFNGNHDTTYTPSAPPTAIRASYATGAGGSLYLGAYLPMNLRAELEAMYRVQPLSTLTVGGVRTLTNGKTQIAAPFLNLFWDIPMPEDLVIQPFVGMGVGAAYVNTTLGDPANTYLRQNRWDLAYSFMTGFSLPVDEASRLSLLYRWMQVRDGGHRCATGGLTTAVCLDNNIDSTSLDLGYSIDL